MVFFWVLISPKNKNKIQIQITVHILDMKENRLEERHFNLKLGKISTSLRERE